VSDDVAVDESLDDGLAPPNRVRIEDAEADLEEAPAEREIPETEQITELTAEERRNLETLCTVGRRVKTVTVFDHSIVLATLNVDDEMRVGLATQQYQNTQGWRPAYQSAIVAAAVRKVDGRTLENTLVENPDPEVLFEQKLKEVRSWYPLVVQYAYNEYLKIEQEFAELARKLGKL
jgi:hypothetical protein